MNIFENLKRFPICTECCCDTKYPFQFSLHHFYFWKAFCNVLFMRSIFKFMSPQFLWLFSSLSPGRLFTSNGWVTCTSESTSTSGRSTSTSSTSPAASTSSPPPSTRCSTTWWAPSTGRLSPGLYSASPQIAQADRRITLVQQLPQIYSIGVQSFKKALFW